MTAPPDRAVLTRDHHFRWLLGGMVALMGVPRAVLIRGC
jgi:hypothetical protein